MATRVNKVGIFFGARGSGKTYYTTKELIPGYRKAHPSMRVLAIDTLDHPDYHDVPRIGPGHIARWSGGGYYRMYGGNTKEMMQAVSESLRNCLLIIEDASKFLQGKLDDDVNRFVLDSKQRNLDIIFMFHGFSFCPPRLLQIADYYTIFRCASPSGRRTIIPNYEEVLRAWQKTNKAKGWPRETVEIF